MYGHKYTDEERAFMMEFVPGHSYKEIAAAFTEKFGWEISIGQVNAYIGNHHLNTGRTGRFQKGHEPANKGKKGTCAAGCEKTWFKKGHLPANHRSVGSERVNTDGYIEIKVEEPNKWKLKHHVIWEAANGPILEGNLIIFKDNNPKNVSLDNLTMITKSINAVLNRTDLHEYIGDFKDTAIALAKLKSISNKAKRRV